MSWGGLQGSGVSSSALANNNVVQRNPTTGLLYVGSSALVVANVDTVPELLALNTTTYNKQRVMVNNPGDNVGDGWGTVAGIPAPAYYYNGAWHWENGTIILGIYSEALTLTCPATTFTSVSVAAGAGGLSTKCALSSAVGVHGLTTANAVTIPAKIRILSGTNWVPGDYSVLLVDDTDTVTIDYTYDAGLGSPTIALVDPTVEREIVRFKMPAAFTTRARWDLEGSFRSMVFPATASSFKIYLVANGAAYTTATSAMGSYNVSTSAANSYSYHAGIQLQNSKSVQRTIFSAASVTGYGSNTVDTEAFAIDMSAATDIVITALIQIADRPLRIGGSILRAYDA